MFKKGTAGSGKKGRVPVSGAENLPVTEEELRHIKIEIAMREAVPLSAVHPGEAVTDERGLLGRVTPRCPACL